MSATDAGLAVGQVIGGRLRVDRIIGVGGFGVVAAATHVELRQQLAVKMLKAEFTEDEEIVQRFLREARAVAALKTEHICRVFDIARTDDGVPYIVMELLQGSDVGSMIRAEPLAVPIAVDFIVQACVGLAEAHRHDIVHRDLKPPNLFVMRRPEGSIVKVLDFGIAKAADELRLTHSMTMLGSPQYMSPEQLTTPKSVDARSDIWSLGVTLYHMVARRLPFPSAQIGELAVMITSQPPKPLPELHPDLAAVIYRCLDKAPARRWPDVGALAHALAPFGTPTTHGYAALISGAPPAAPAPVPVAVTASTQASMPAMPAMSPPAMSSPSMPAAASSPGMSTSASMSPSVAQQLPMQVPMPTAHVPPLPTAQAAKRSRAMMIVPLAVLLVGGGVAVGYAMRGSSSSSSTPQPSPAPAPVERVVSVDAAVPAVVEEIDAANAVQAAQASELAQIEANMRRHKGDEATLQILYFNAIGMACNAGEVVKARGYLSMLTDDSKKQAARANCKLYNVEL